MPILDYTGSAGVFKHLGAIIARVNSYQTVGATTLPADLALLLAAFGTTWLPEEGVAGYYEGLRDSVTGWRQGLASFADRRLLDLETVTRPLGLQPGASLEETLVSLRKAMRDDAQTVRSCACGAGIVGYSSLNVGDGRVYITTTLDGFNPPVAGGISDWSYDGKATELTVPSETMTLECVADAQMDGLAVGGEAWRWSGAPDHGPLDVRTQGSGEGPGLLTGNEGYNLLRNGSMDTWPDSSEVPSGWTGSGVFRADDPTGGYRAGSTGPFALSQDVPLGTVQGRRRYWVGFRAIADAAIPGTSIELKLEATGWSPGAQAQLDGATFLADTWRYAGAFVTVPSPIPADLHVSLRRIGSGGAVAVDECVLTPVVYHGGVGVVVQAGVNPWLRGDRATWTVSNDAAGQFQTFFRRWFRCQLPSVASAAAQGTFLTLLMLLMPSQAAETISESLVA